jgi:hypothetical protein
MSTPTITSATRKISEEQVKILKQLQPGQRIQIVQTVRVGKRKWTTTVSGIYRSLNYLATGVTTERVPEDDMIVPILHFTKDNGELSSIAIDENSQISVVAS